MGFVEEIEKLCVLPVSRDLRHVSECKMQFLSMPHQDNNAAKINIYFLNIFPNMYPFSKSKE